MAWQQVLQRFADAVLLERRAQKHVEPVAFEILVLDQPLLPVVAADVPERQVRRQLLEALAGGGAHQHRIARLHRRHQPGRVVIRRSQALAADGVDRQQQLVRVGNRPDRHRQWRRRGSRLRLLLRGRCLSLGCGSLRRPRDGLRHARTGLCRGSRGLRRSQGRRSEGQCSAQQKRSQSCAHGPLKAH